MTSQLGGPRYCDGARGGAANGAAGRRSVQAEGACLARRLRGLVLISQARRIRMSIVVRYAPVPSSTIEQYDEVMRRLQVSGEMPADGFEYHVAFLSDGQLLVSEVWDSPQQLQAFGARIMPLLADVALEHSGQPQIFKVHNIIRR